MAGQAPGRQGRKVRQPGWGGMGLTTLQAAEPLWNTNTKENRTTLKCARVPGDHKTNAKRGKAPVRPPADETGRRCGKGVGRSACASRDDDYCLLGGQRWKRSSCPTLCFSFYFLFFLNILSDRGGVGATKCPFMPLHVPFFLPYKYEVHALSLYGAQVPYPKDRSPCSMRLCGNPTGCTKY